MMRFQPNSEPDVPVQNRVVARTGRKIALCGSHSNSLKDAPWFDPSWEFWGHSSSRAWYPRPLDRYFDLHPRVCWTRGGKKGLAYPRWLAKNTVPIYMQERHDDVPASVKYPKGRILLEFADARGYFTNHAAWMIALALTEGVSTLVLFGINYSTESEYIRQRGSCEYWLGRAAGMGVRIVLPEQCSLLREPATLYGYESHDAMGKLLPEYQSKIWKEPKIAPVPPTFLSFSSFLIHLTLASTFSCIFFGFLFLLRQHLCRLQVTQLATLPLVYSSPMFTGLLIFILRLFKDFVSFYGMSALLSSIILVSSIALIIERRLTSSLSQERRSLPTAGLAILTVGAILFSFAFLAPDVHALLRRNGHGAPQRPQRRPNMMLIVLDTVRADHLSCYGNTAPPIGGVMVIPIGPVGGYQELWRIERVDAEQVQAASLGGVRFVPLVRAAEVEE